MLFTPKKQIDLSQTIFPGISVYPGDPMFFSKPFADHQLDGFFGSCWTLGTHTGTHLDFPFHFFIDGEKISDFPPDIFFGEACVLDLSSYCLNFPKNKQYNTDSNPSIISRELLEPFEKLFDSVPRIIIRTGWEKYAGLPQYYTNFPSFSLDTIQWITEFPLQILGIDLPSLSSLGQTVFVSDASNSSEENFNEQRQSSSLTKEQDIFLSEEMNLHADAEEHRLLLGRTPPILILEGLVHLDQIPSYVLDISQKDIKTFPFLNKNEHETVCPILTDETKHFILSCYPLPIGQSEASPVRAVALLG